MSRKNSSNKCHIYRQNDIRDVLNLSLSWIYNADDKGGRLISSLEYAAGDCMQIFSIGFLNTGSADAEFRTALDSSLMLGVEYTFFNIPFHPMLVQPLVENAIKHGFEPKIGGGEIWINCSIDDNMQRIEIADVSEIKKPEVKDRCH